MAGDPDYLRAVALCLNDLHPARRNVVDPPLENVLDAFARLLLHKFRNHVVEIGAGLDAGHIELYVSENTVVLPLTVDHLRNICTQLDPAEPSFASLRNLQRSLICHSIGHVQARFTKPYWPDKVDHVLGALEMLQASSVIQKSVGTFDGAVKSIDKASNYDVDNVRLACVILDHPSRKRPAFVMVFFDHFVHAYVIRTHGPLRKSPNMVKWLRKVSFVIAEYLVLIKILTIPTLSALAFVTELEIVDITTVFVGLEFNVDNFEGIQDLIDDVQPKVKHVHCKCALLYRLEQLGQVMLPYIGVSKLSCVFCEMYFACYRLAKGSGMRTRGTHGQTTARMWPDIPRDGPIRTLFCEKARQYLKERLANAKTQRLASTSSQSTTASNDIGQNELGDDDKQLAFIMYSE
ncbi:hypothetical protein BC628DRAFT_1431501 [Trametes gibbosa]|nr:hypothetical protein BC628DRAFT_1431501 [Trametes gibbosa]